MNSKKYLEARVFAAARDQGISSVVFRNAMRQKLGLTITDSECLAFLGIKGVATPKELAQHTGLSTGATTAMLDRMEKAGFIIRKPNPNDRRGALVEVNPSSIQKTKPLVADIQQAHRELLATYSKEELEVIADFLTKFTKNVQEHTKKLST